jgi:hypothetical protein
MINALPAAGKARGSQPRAIALTSGQNTSVSIGIQSATNDDKKSKSETLNEMFLRLKDDIVAQFKANNIVNLTYLLCDKAIRYELIINESLDFRSRIRDFFARHNLLIGQLLYAQNVIRSFLRSNDTKGITYAFGANVRSLRAYIRQDDEEMLLFEGDQSNIKGLIFTEILITVMLHYCIQADYVSHIKKVEYAKSNNIVELTSLGQYEYRYRFTMRLMSNLEENTRLSLVKNITNDLFAQEVLEASNPPQ